MNLKKYEPHIKIVSIVAEIAAIIALVFAVFSYWHSENIQKENEKIILENAKNEINYNLFIISNLNDSKDYYLESYSFTINRFQYFYLEKALDFTKDNETRFVIFRLVQGMSGENRLMDRISGNSFFNNLASPSYSEQFTQIRKDEIANILSFSQDKIKPALESLKNKL